MVGFPCFANVRSEGWMAKLLWLCRYGIHLAFGGPGSFGTDGKMGSHGREWEKGKNGMGRSCGLVFVGLRY